MACLSVISVVSTCQTKFGNYSLLLKSPYVVQLLILALLNNLYELHTIKYITNTTSYDLCRKCFPALLSEKAESKIIAV